MDLHQSGFGPEAVIQHVGFVCIHLIYLPIKVFRTSKMFVIVLHYITKNKPQKPEAEKDYTQFVSLLLAMTVAQSFNQQMSSITTFC